MLSVKWHCKYLSIYTLLPWVFIWLDRLVVLVESVTNRRDAIERGTRGIQSLISYALYSILPTFIEFCLVLGY